MAERSAKRWTPVVFASLSLAQGTAAGQVRGEAIPPVSIGPAGGPLTVEVAVDLGTTGKSLGSYGASLAWDPAVLQYTGFQGGDPPFGTPVVNTNDTGLGLLRFADADPLGLGGRVVVLRVDFVRLAGPPLYAPLDLGFSSLFAAQTFEDLSPLLLVRDGAVCVQDFLFDLRVSDPVATILNWTSVPPGVPGVTFDAIRGDLDSLSRVGPTVHLGTVTCRENDSQDTTTGAGTEPFNPDSQAPNPGEGFFYLLRFFDGVTKGPWGFADDCVGERVVDAGDCP